MITTITSPARTVKKPWTPAPRTSAIEGRAPPVIGAGSSSRSVTRENAVRLSRYRSRPSVRSSSSWTRSTSSWTFRTWSTPVVFAMIRWYCSSWRASEPRLAARSTYSSVTSWAWTDSDRTVPTVRSAASVASNRSSGTRTVTVAVRRSPLSALSSRPATVPFWSAATARTRSRAGSSDGTSTRRSAFRISFGSVGAEIGASGVATAS